MPGRAPKEATDGRYPRLRSNPNSAAPHCDATTTAAPSGGDDAAGVADPRPVTTDGDREMTLSGDVRDAGQRSPMKSAMIKKVRG